MVNKKNQKLISGTLAASIVFSTGFLNSSPTKAEVIAEDLFISEYIEGSSNNKAIEIFNGTGSDVDLSVYKIELYSNGADAPGSNVLNLSGTLKNGEVYIIGNSGAGTDIKSKANIESTVTYFNGDDALVLKHNDTVIDSIGKVGEDPGTDWKGADGIATTLDRTLVRKKTITKGNSNYSDAFDPAVEWDTYPKDTFSNLGTHTMDASSNDQIQKVSNIIASTPSGEINKGTEITLSCATEGAEIFYTLDGTVPTNASTKYTAPIVINEGTSIKAIAIKDGIESSDISTFNYTIKPENQEISTIKQIRDISKDLAIGASMQTTAVKGIVTRVNGSETYFQDETAGMLLYKSGLGLTPGDEIKVSGTLKNYNGKLEYVDTVVVEKGEHKEVPAPKVVSIDEIDESVESMLIQLNGVVLGETASNNTPITKDSKSINIFKMPVLNNITAGSSVNVIALGAEYKGTYQLTVTNAEDIQFSLEDTTPPVLNHTPITEANISQNILLEVAVTDDRTIAGVKCYYRVKGEASFKALNMSLNAGKYTAEILSTELKTEGLEYYIEATDGKNITTSPANINNPYSITITNADMIGPEVTNVMPMDNSETKDNLRPEIMAEYSDLSEVDTTSVKLYLNDVEITNKADITKTSITYTPTEDLQKGINNGKLELSDTKGNKTIKSWSFTVGNQEYNFYFGELHSHTNVSDGQGTLEEAYNYAKNTAKADFFAVTDHSNSFDNDVTGSLLNADGSENPSAASTEWAKMHEAADKYNEDGKFAALAGFEMTWSGSTGGWGHINTFNTKGFETRNHKDMDLKKYYETISKIPVSISQLNHPGNTFGDFADFGYYSKEADAVVNLIEVGNGEGAIGGSGYFPSYDEYTRALDKGWHVAPTNNEDNHKGKWTDGNAGSTVVLSPTLTREGILEAMRNRRVYATEDQNLKIMYKINDKIMGSILDKSDKLTISIDIKDPDLTDKIGKVSIIADGGTVVQSKNFDGNTAIWQIELDPQYNYYYLRVDEGDKDIAVSAPIWTGEVAAVGIGKVAVSQDPQIINNPVDITATVYNNGQNSLENVKVEYFINSLEQSNKIGENIIAAVNASTTQTSKITWTPTAAGDYKIYAKTTLNIGGVEKVFTEGCTLKASKEEDITKVVIDGGHQNQYVSGDYAGKMTAIAENLKNKEVMLVQNNDELTEEDLKNAKVLIITDPQSKDKASANLTKSNFTDAEVKVISDFVKNGGSLIITSRADYDDKGITEKQYESSAQGNRILEAIGSNLKFNDDEVIDKESNGGQEYRLYFDDYTSTKFNLTNDIPEGLTYSAYSGCSVILKDGGSAENVDWLVKGHDTTEILDSDLQNDATPVNKGEVNSLAAEILPGGGKVVVAGTTFFSDFETASADNAYSNLKIFEKIYEWATRPEYKTISQVRADDNKDGKPDLLGKKFTIEGRVTAASKAAVNNTAFFDVIYVEDQTGGITVFGVSTKAIPLGAKVRIVGTVDQYDGDTELQISDENINVEILDNTIQFVEPKEMTTGDSMKEENEGLLVKIQGIVTKITENALYINDGSGDARVYVNGYIGDDTNNPNALGKWDSNIKLGDTVSAIGLASEDPEGHRLRVRNTSEIAKVKDSSGLTIEKISMPDKVKRNQDAKVTIKATNSTENAKMATLIVVLYDENNKLINYSAVTQNIKPNDSVEMTSLMRVLENGQKVKCMLWDSLDGMMPLSEVIEIAVED